MGSVSLESSLKFTQESHYKKVVNLVSRFSNLKISSMFLKCRRRVPNCGNILLYSIAFVLRKQKVSFIKTDWGSLVPSHGQRTVPSALSPHSQPQVPKCAGRVSWLVTPPSLPPGRPGDLTAQCGVSVLELGLGGGVGTRDTEHVVRTCEDKNSRLSFLLTSAALSSPLRNLQRWPQSNASLRRSSLPWPCS